MIKIPHNHPAINCASLFCRDINVITAKHQRATYYFRDLKQLCDEMGYDYKKVYRKKFPFKLDTYEINKTKLSEITWQ